MKQFIFLFALLIGAHASAQDPSESDYRSHMDQARFFLKRGWLEDAREELQKATNDPNGRLDAEAWFLLAHLEFQRCDLAAAQKAISQAHTHAKDNQELQQVHGFESLLNHGIGWVALPKYDAGEKGKLTILTTVFAPDLKHYIRRIQERLAKNKPLPTPLGLPAGRYEFDGWAFDILANEVTQSDVTSTAPNASVAGLQFTAGAGAWFGPSQAHLGIYGHAAVDLLWASGPWHIGGGVHWSPQPYRTADGLSSTQWSAWGGGIRAGVSAPKGPFRLTVDLGYRLTVLQPVALQCAEVGPDTFTCGNGNEQDLVLYPRVLAHIPSIGFTIAYKPHAWGIGLGLNPEYAVGAVRPSGVAEILAEDSEIRYNVESEARHWRSFGMRLGLQINRSF